MGTASKAAVVEGPKQSPSIEEIELTRLAHDEVLVRLVAAGVCHTDVAWADGDLFSRFPVVLGHECAGVVEEVGSEVKRVSTGDRVSIALSHHCGHCGFCETGRPMLCTNNGSELRRMSQKGAPVLQGFGVGGFSEHTVVREASTIKIPEAVPMEVAALVGCATSTGVGAVFNIAHVEYGSRVAVLGVGGVGLNVVMGCVLAGAERIVAVDPNEVRRVHALNLGATDAVAPSEELLREIAPDGFEFVFESVGQPDAIDLAVRITRRGGTVTIIGAPRPDVTIRVPALEFVPSQRRLLGCLTGNVRPDVDFDRFFRLYARGKLPLDYLVTSVVPFGDIVEAFGRARRGDGIRTVLRISEE
jgi:alcohol dehydrogenase